MITQPNADLFSNNLNFFVMTRHRMGTARLCNLARLFLTLRERQRNIESLVAAHPEVIQILIRVSDPVPLHQYSPYSPKFTHQDLRSAPSFYLSEKAWYNHCDYRYIFQRFSGRSVDAARCLYRRNEGYWTLPPIMALCVPAEASVCVLYFESVVRY
jgi:hypothetical protein